MYCPKFAFSFFIYFKTVDESLHKKTWLTFNLSSLKIVVFNLEAKTAASSSNRGIVIVLFLTGANLLLPKIKLQYMVSGLDMRRYETAP